MTLMIERPTTSGTEPHGFEDLLDTLDESDVPGYRAEIIRGAGHRVLDALGQGLRVALHEAFR